MGYGVISVSTIDFGSVSLGSSPSSLTTDGELLRWWMGTRL